VSAIAPQSHERTRRTGHRRGGGILAIGAASAFFYAVTAIAESGLEHGSQQDEPSTLLLRLGAYVGSTLALFGLSSGLLVRIARHAPSGRGRILAIAIPVVFNVIFVFVPPNLSIDLLSYVAHGSIATATEGNPLVEPASKVADTPLGADLVEHGWRAVHGPSPYGPLWTRIEAAVVGWIGSLEGRMLGLKAVAAIASLGSALLIWKILSHVRPQHRLIGTLAYLWNPLIVLEVAKEGHNDPLMAFFVLGALLLTIRGTVTGSIIAMSLGALTKYLPLILMPVQFVYQWRTRRSTTRFAVQLGLAVTVVIVLTLVLFGRMWEGAETLASVRAAAGLSEQTGSTRWMASYAAARLTPAPSLEPFVDGALIIGVVAFVAAAAWSVRGKEGVLRASAAVSLVYLLIGSPTYWPWYAVLPVALLAAVPSQGAILMLLAVSLGARLAGPIDILTVHGVLGWQANVVLTWLLGIGIPLSVALATRGRGWRPSEIGRAR
jgi:alpha-1,6-mannosyltransferase